MSHRIDHIGIAVRRLDERLPFWADALGLSFSGFETVEGEQVKVAFLQAGQSRIELLEPMADDSVVARHLARRGEGIHHMALEVADLDAALGRLRSRGIEPIGSVPRGGAAGRRVAFLHPRSTGGVLVELSEPAAVPYRWDEPSIVAGAPVLLYLRDPQEKIWGVLRQLDAAGVVAEGIDLASFEDWVAQIERGEDSVGGPSILFIPMARVERLLLDRSSGQLPSLAERFERRVGRTVQQVLAEIERQAAG
jgi:methylmalonyl-CoA/ethylmalonyl-CoA epimerase